MCGAGLAVAYNGAVRHHPRGGRAVFFVQCVECRLQVVFTDRCQKSEAAEVDSKDWNRCAFQQFRTEQHGAVAAHSEQNVHGGGELLEVDHRGGGQMLGRRLIGEQRPIQLGRFAGEPLEHIRGVRAFRVCNNTDFFHTVDCYRDPSDAQGLFKRMSRKINPTRCVIIPGKDIGWI